MILISPSTASFFRALVAISRAWLLPMAQKVNNSFYAWTSYLPVVLLSEVFQTGKLILLHSHRKATSCGKKNTPPKAMVMLFMQSGRCGIMVSSLEDPLTGGLAGSQGSTRMVKSCGK